MQGVRYLDQAARKRDGEHHNQLRSGSFNCFTVIVTV